MCHSKCFLYNCSSYTYSHFAYEFEECAYLVTHSDSCSLMHFISYNLLIVLFITEVRCDSTPSMLTHSHYMWIDSSSLLFMYKQIDSRKDSGQTHLVTEVTLALKKVLFSCTNKSLKKKHEGTHSITRKRN